ncbi:S41 family peptidase [Pedobacter alpinus]|uniref:S41 family peptidase n=1 Tax=Pedobacter alpinus TaxID=1590643 RepID=A0ABW5TV03_9SPHI
MRQTFIKITLVSILISAFFSACKKDNISNNDSPIATGSRDELTKDSMFLYAKELYLWNTDLPTYNVFNPRGRFNSGDLITQLKDELFAITRFGINPLNSRPYEFNEEDPNDTKYAYIEDLITSGKLTAVPNTSGAINNSGEGNDFGFSLALVGSLNNYRIYFQFASPGSPSALKGLGRGDYIDQIDGRTIGTNFNAESDFINTAINNSTITIEGKKKDGTSYSYILNKTKYTSSPIYKDTVLTNGSKKIGYLAYAKFTDEKNSKAALTNVFAKFATANVTDLVIDLRYNGGGFVSTAEDLLNLIAPSSLNSKVMFIETYNAALQAGRASILKNQPIRDQDDKIVFVNGKVANYADNVSYDQASNTSYFSKAGGLNNISKVVFITTENTASASELVINSLKPYLDVKTVGSKSYGKPVGFFPVRIDKYELYLSSFSTRNSLGEGNYFAGIVPNYEEDDDVRRDFGNPNELSLASAINYIVNNRFVNSSNSNLRVNGTKQVSKSNEITKNIYMPSDFKGMIDVPKNVK